MTNLRRLTRFPAHAFPAFLLAATVACGGAGSPPQADATAEATAADAAGSDAGPPEIAPLPRGLVVDEAGVSDGYVLFGPLLSDTTFLMDNDGNVVHTWQSEYAPSGTVYLLPNGNILRGAREPGVAVFRGGGQGGRLEEFTWSGEKVWDYAFASEEHLLHHDIEVLPNGNILAIAWEAKSADEVRAAGRDPATIPENGLWPDKVVEIEPQHPGGGRVVWEWHAWDHLVQDQDSALPNFGDPAEHPGRIDINAGAPPEIDPEELEQLKALGYVPPDTQPEDIGSDLFHTNAIAYNAELDQIALSSPRYNEIWIIDHGTTTEEAASSGGGRWGKGGDLLYRWGNPANYGLGDADDQRLFAQHDVRWVPAGRPGGGHLMIFNNDVPSADGNHSEVVEVAAPMDAAGYVRPEGRPFAPAEPTHRHDAAADGGFYSPFISGATRLPNGNTLICAGAQGRFLEIDPDGRIVWDYRDHHSGDVRMPDGSTPHPVGEFTYAVFRATRIPLDHPALRNKTLNPLDPQPPAAGQSRD